MWLKSLQLGSLETNCWLVGDDAGEQAVVIDPAGDHRVILDAIGERHLTAVVLTHCHFDHIEGARGLVAQTGAPLIAHVLDAAFLSEAAGTGSAIFGFGDITAPAPDRLLEDGDVVEAAGLHFEVLHTPGHTPGSISLFVSAADTGGVPHLFSGDTLFAGSVGRTDFPRGDGQALRQSLARKLVALPPETRVHPGHGPDTTIGREAQVNMFWPRA